MDWIFRFDRYRIVNAILVRHSITASGACAGGGLPTLPVEPSAAAGQGGGGGGGVPKHARGRRGRRATHSTASGSCTHTHTKKKREKPDPSQPLPTTVNPIVELGSTTEDVTIFLHQHHNHCHHPPRQNHPPPPTHINTFTLIRPRCYRTSYHLLPAAVFAAAAAAQSPHTSRKPPSTNYENNEARQRFHVRDLSVSRSALQHVSASPQQKHSRPTNVCLSSPKNRRFPASALYVAMLPHTRATTAFHHLRQSQDRRQDGFISLPPPFGRFKRFTSLASQQITTPTNYLPPLSPSLF